MRKYQKLTRIHALLTALLLLWAGASSCWAQEVDPRVAYKVKAAYLYNFTRFIDWPPKALSSQNNTFSICVLGKNHFGSSLNSIADKIVRGRKLVVRKINTVHKAKNCQVVFVSKSERSGMGRILMELRKYPVLSVGETANFNELGGIINFSVADKKVRFSINTDAAKRARLTISSKLLNLATIIRESRP